MENLLEVKNLQFSFRTYGGVVKAVRDVSFEVRPGEILGIVGESGCGKSVTSQCLMRLNPEPPGFFEGGEILYKGKDVLKMNKKELRQFRGKEISYIFQDPMTSLNPTMRIGKQIEEVFVGRKGMSAAEKKAKALEILKMVGISDGERRYKQYPHELSGGMKQRVMIAIALVGSPSIVIADEPTTSLDVTIEAQILDVLKNLQKTLGAVDGSLRWDSTILQVPQQSIWSAVSVHLLVPKSSDLVLENMIKKEMPVRFPDTTFPLQLLAYLFSGSAGSVSTAALPQQLPQTSVISQ